jgi:hypothetical protein
MVLIEHGFEIVGLVEFLAPYLTTEKGDERIARFTAQYGVLNMTGLYLWRNKYGVYHITLGESRREERSWISSQQARNELTQLAVTSRDRLRPDRLKVIREGSLKTARREGNSNSAGYARAGVTSHDTARDK